LLLIMQHMIGWLYGEHSVSCNTNNSEPDPSDMDVVKGTP
jgi:hypothetical protein